MKKNNLILILLFAVALMAIVFAALSTTLTITGSGSLSGTWGPIYITDCACKATTIKDTSNPPTATCTPNNGTSSSVTATITANMKLPGDVVACTFNVKNDGSFHATTPTISVGTNSYFSVTTEKTPINAGGTGYINVYVSYTKEVSSAQTITLTADYKQSASSNTIPVYTTVPNTSS